MIRYFCHADGASALSLLSLFWLDILQRLAVPIRVIAISTAELNDYAGRRPTPWGEHAALFQTPIADDYVNVVCGSAQDWERYWTIGHRNVMLFTGSVSARIGAIPSGQTVVLIDLETKFSLPTDLQCPTHLIAKGDVASLRRAVLG